MHAVQALARALAGMRVTIEFCETRVDKNRVRRGERPDSFPTERRPHKSRWHRARRAPGKSVGASLAGKRGWGEALVALHRISVQGAARCQSKFCQALSRSWPCRGRWSQRRMGYPSVVEELLFIHPRKLPPATPACGTLWPTPNGAVTDDAAGAVGLSSGPWPRLAMG